MSPRIHPLIIRGRFPPRHVAAYTPSYYTRQISTLTCRRVYTLILYAADFHPVISPRIHPLIIRGTYPSCHVAAYAPSYYTRHISILSCRRVYTLLLYAALFHPVMSPSIHSLTIPRTFTFCHLPTYIPYISVLSCHRLYTLLLYPSNFIFLLEHLQLFTQNQFTPLLKISPSDSQHFTSFILTLPSTRADPRTPMP